MDFEVWPICSYEDMKQAGVMTFTAVGHQGVINLSWLYFWVSCRQYSRKTLLLSVQFNLKFAAWP